MNSYCCGLHSRSVETHPQARSALQFWDRVYYRPQGLFFFFNYVLVFGLHVCLIWRCQILWNWSYTDSGELPCGRWESNWVQFCPFSFYSWDRVSLCSLNWPQTHSASAGLTDTAFTSGLPEHLNNNVQSRWDCKAAKTTMGAGESEFETEDQRVRKAAFVTIPNRWFHCLCSLACSSSQHHGTQLYLGLSPGQNRAAGCTPTWTIKSPAS